MKNLLKIILLASCFFTLFAASAQTPQKMSYQAVIRNSGNVLVANTNVSMRISILQGSSTGTATYVETQNTTTNANGLATIQIGAGTTSTGVFSDLQWSNGLFFIKTETDPTGGTNYTISATSQLMSVPYALYAEKSGNTWGTSGNAGTNPTSNFIGTTDDNDIVFKRNGILAGKISNDNVSLGKNAFQFNTTGVRNTAIGKYALYFNTIGTDNSAIGSGTLLSNTTGYGNTANGTSALSYNTTGSRNTAVGFDALILNTTGNDNTANGVNSLASNTDGYSNTAVGTKSLNKNTIGMKNSAVGTDALRTNISGNDNSAFGFEALLANTWGDHNTATGTRSLSANTVGSSNTAVGFETIKNHVNGHYNTAIGRGALRSQTSGDQNTAIGTFALSAANGGIDNTAIGSHALYNITSGNNNVGIGFNAMVPNAAGNHQIKLGNTAISYFGCQVGLSITSDSRWKSDIKKTSLGLNFINKLNPVSYTRKNDDSKKLEYGFIAQEMDATLKQLDAKNNGMITKDDAGMYSVRYNDLLAPMVKAIQEQQIMIEQLTKRIAELEKK